MALPSCMPDKFERLRDHLGQIQNLRKAVSVLEWDQHTYMPPGGAVARSEQLATLARLAHEAFVSDETGELLESARQEVENLPYESDEVSLVRVTQRDFDKLRKVPTALVTEIERHSSLAHPIWVEARTNNDFPSFAPYLEKTVKLSQELANYLGYEDNIYDALLDRYEPGMKTAQVQSIFEDLKGDLVPLVANITERKDQVDGSIVRQDFDEARQEAFGRMVIERFGYDFSRGRLDRTVHPFATTFSRDDVRVTTRYRRDYLNDSLLSTMHESGHAMYGQGVAPSLEATPLAGAPSLGLNESQSRMWENVVGRSRGFWQYFYPQLQSYFPEQLGQVEMEVFYGSINRVEPSFIRVDADEVTYNLHIMLRFEMEQELLKETYSVSEAPEVWNEKSESYLGFQPPTNTVGILQDVHWSGGLMGYFATYSLGNILSVQIFEKAVRDVPEIPDQISRGQFDSLLAWLQENLYRYGRKFEPVEMVERLTGEPIQSRSYMSYLQNKYGEIYGI